MRKVALITHDFSELAGSTILALEIANYFAELGDFVTIRAERFSEELRPYLNKNVAISHVRIDICDFDLVWSQHGHFCLNTRNLEDLRHWNGIFISAHLSAYTPAETYHYPFASRYADAVIFNAESVEEILMKRNKPSGFALNLKNGAPPSFHIFPSDERISLQSILVVSNHLPLELLQAIDKLRSVGITVKHIGRGGTLKLIQPEDIQSADAIISIGKTVQYALTGGRPVYCYDHFGGPGWLVADNFKEAERHNFSGRCTGEAKSADQISDEVLHGYIEAMNFARSNWLYSHENYNLGKTLNRLLDELENRGTSNHFNNETCLEEIDSMRGATLHVDWIWPDVFGRPFRDEMNNSLKIMRAQFDNERANFLQEIRELNDSNSEITILHGDAKAELAQLKKCSAAQLQLMSASWLLGLLRSPWRISHWNRVRRRQRALKRDLF